MTKKYFGTDGIRGTANKFPMTAEIALKVGMAIGAKFIGRASNSISSEIFFCHVY